MFRGYGKRDLAAWTVIICLVAFGAGAVFVKRFRPVGPMEFHELPAAEAKPSGPLPTKGETIPAELSGPRMAGIPAGRLEAPLRPPARGYDTPPRLSSQGPDEPAAAPKSHSKAKAEPDTASIALNSGQLADFEKLPGVGPGIAQRIIDYRTEHGPFQTLDELRNVKGIGEKRFAKMEPYLRL